MTNLLKRKVESHPRQKGNPKCPQTLVHEQTSFRELAATLLDADAGRIQNAPEWSESSSKSRLARTLEILETNEIYRDDYKKFVVALSYARDAERTGYDEALDALRGLADTIFC